jgi:3-isopropylmalate/(R)-2-methylmalate dehydratase small subunit
MEQLVAVTGTAAPIMRINVDTDQIIPARFLVRTSDEGIAEALFADWRKTPEFILNRSPYNRAAILLADRNFGCGSSREAAPKALRASGFRAVLAPSFGGIFYNNCFRNGIVPVELAYEKVKAIADEVEAGNGAPQVTVNLETRTVTTPGGLSFGFKVPSAMREMMLSGQDEVEITLQRKPAIDTFRASDRARRPWVYAPGAG